MEYTVSRDGRILMSRGDLKKHGLIQARKRSHVTEEGWQHADFTSSSSSDSEEDLEVDKEFIRSLLVVRPSKNLQRLFQILEGIPEQTACSAGPLPTPAGRPVSYSTPAEKASSEEPRGPKPLRPSNVSGREKKDKKEKKKDKQECTFTETELRRVVCEAIRAELGWSGRSAQGHTPQQVRRKAPTSPRGIRRRTFPIVCRRHLTRCPATASIRSRCRGTFQLRKPSLALPPRPPVFRGERPFYRRSPAFAVRNSRSLP